MALDALVYTVEMTWDCLVLLVCKDIELDLFCRQFEPP